MTENAILILVKHCNCDPLVQDDCNKNPLHYASGNGHLDIVRYLTSTASCDPF